MSLAGIVNYIEKQVTILDKTLTVRTSDDNLFEKYFDVSELKNKWHEKKVGKYHFSQLLGCLRKYYWSFQLELKDTPEQMGIYLIGTILHRYIQENIEKHYGFSIIERPCVDECDDFDILGKVDVIDILEHIETDIKTTQWLPIFADLDESKFEEKYGKYILQVLAYAYFLNKTYFKIDPLQTLRIILVDKSNLAVKLIEFDFDEGIGEYFYLKIRERAKYLHDCLTLLQVCDQFHLDKNCKFCPVNDTIYCPEGAELVKSLTTPETPESLEFKQKYEVNGRKKKPFWKYDEDTKKWIKSKEFVKFLKEEKEYSDEQIEEVGW